MYLPQGKYQYYDSYKISNVYKFKAYDALLDYYLHFTDFEDIFANMLCCINICFAWDLLLKSKKRKSYFAPKYYILW